MKRQSIPHTSRSSEPKARKYSVSHKRPIESSSEESDEDIASQGNRHKKIKIEAFKRNTLLDELQSILHDYPDNEQIIKELLQNAEDAGASVVKILCHPGGDVSHIKAPYKDYLCGPALCFYNDSTFTEEDWDGIIMLRKSNKKSDALKVGKFGIGFKSVFHMTDYCCVVSGTTILFMDPIKDENRRILIKNYCRKEICGKQGLAPLNGIFGIDSHHIRHTGYDGTLFWFPLRRKASVISETTYSIAKVDDLIKSFSKNLELELLFLKYIEKIELHKYVGKNIITDVKAEIDQSSLKKVNEERKAYKLKLFEVENTLKNGQSLERESPIWMHNTMCLKIARLGTENKEQWMILQYFHGGSTDRDIVRLLRSTHSKYRPYVGIAARVDKNISHGKLFCFLPLPTDRESPTGLPVHVNGYFALDSNRQHIKWPSRDQSVSESHLEDDMLWNKYLIEVLLPIVYKEFLKKFKTHCENENNKQGMLELFYQYIPTRSSTKEEWECIVDSIDDYLITSQVPCLEKRLWVKTKEATFSIFANISDECKEAVHKLFRKCLGNGLVNLGKNTEVFNDLVRRKKSIKSTSPQALRDLMKEFDVYKQYSALSKAHFLIYSCSENEIPMDLAGLELIETQDKRHAVLEVMQGNQYRKCIFLCDHGEEAFLLGKENQLVKSRQKSEMLEEVLQSIIRTGKYNFKPLDPSTCIKLLEDVLQTKVKGLFSYEWVRNVWKYMDSKFQKSLDPLKHLPIVPVKGQDVFLRRLSDCLFDNTGIENGNLWVEILAFFNVFVVKENLLHHHLLQPGKGYVHSAVKERLSFIEKHFSIGVDDFNAQGTEEQKEELNRYLATNNTKLSSGLLGCLKKLQIFKRQRSLKNFECFTSIEDCKTVFMGDEDFPLPFTRSMIVTFSKKESELVRKLSDDVEDLTRIIFNSLEELIGNPFWITNEMKRRLCHYILEKKHKLRNWENIVDRVKDIPCIRNRSGESKAFKTLYDPNDKVLTDIFDDSKFPCDEDVYLLQQIGCLTQKDARFVNDIEMVCKKIHAAGEKYDGKKLRAISKALIQVMKEHSKICHRVSEYNILPYMKEKVDHYPKSLQWFKTEGLVKMDSLQLRKNASLIGSVMPVATEECEIFLPKVKEVPVENVRKQFQNVLKNYTIKEHSKYMTIMISIYQYFEQKMLLGFREFEKFILTEQGFQDISSVYVARNTKKDIDTVPFLIPLPMELEKFRTLFIKCKCYPSQTPASLLEVLRKLKVKYGEVFQTDEIDKDFDLIEKILRRLSKEDPIPDVILPIRSRNPKCILFKPAKECVYADTDWFSRKFTEDEHVNFVHSKISKPIAKAFGARSLKEYTLADAEEMFEEFGQSEKLTLRIKSLLEGYTDGLSVPKEIIQNADDAGATIVKFLYDERENREARAALIDPNMKSFQGPALWAFNDAEFTDEDFKNIQKISEATKKEDTTKIGTFGVGFNAVYNLTDVPSFVSRGSLVYLDPHEKYLGEALEGKRQSPGIKLQLRNKVMLDKMRDQFFPYENIFGFKVSEFHEGKTFQGTLFRLPLRTEVQAKYSEISQKPYTANEMEKFVYLICKAAGNLLLFTQNVQKLEFYRLQNTKESPEKYMKLILRVTKDWLSKPCTILKEATQQLKINPSQPFINRQLVIITVHDKSSRHSVQWLLSWSTGNKKSLTLYKDKKSDGALPLACIAVPVIKDGTSSIILCENMRNLPSGFYKEGHLFCYLPLPIMTGLPFHVNGNFSISADRQRLLVTTSDEKEDSKHVVWNNCLIEDAVLNAFLALILHLRHEINNEKYVYYSLWPTKTENIWQRLDEKFYLKITGDSTLQVFQTSRGWKTFKECKFLDPTLQKNEKLKTIALDLIATFERDALFISDLPVELLRKVKDFCEPAQLITREIFACEYFLGNVERNECKTNYDYILLTILQWDTESIKAKISIINCIPTLPSGKKRCPKDLVDPSRDISKLFSESDMVFPTEPYMKKDFRKSLLKLGMMKQEKDVPLEKLIQQTKKVQSLFERCQGCASDRIDYIISFIKIANLGKTELQNLMDIQFLPAKEKPIGWSYPWYLQKIQEHKTLKKLCSNHRLSKLSDTILCRPHDLFLSSAKNCIGSQRLVLGLPDEQQMENEILLRSLGVRSFDSISIDMLSNQLSEVLKHAFIEKNTKGICMDLYNAFNKILGNVQNKNELGLDKFSNTECILIDGKFICPDRIVFSLKFNCEPYFFHLERSELLKYKRFLKAVGVRDEFETNDIIKVFKEIKRTNENRKLPRKSLDAVCRITSLLPSMSEIGNYEFLHLQLYLPDKNGIMRKASDLCQNDCEWIPDSPGMCFLHPNISKSVATLARIKSKREQDLLTTSFEFGFDFGQHEDLKIRLKKLLEGYPEISILKELLQNADDAGASELHFIMDYRMHKTVKVFSDKWKELQGPALCVYNDSVFTEEDIQGIQNLGMGSKSEDPTKTGRYGVGFNAVYRLTDVPCFLCKDSDQICILDPLREYIAHPQNGRPGRRFSNATECLRQRYPDILTCFLTETKVWKGGKGTLFRFPLRNRNSVISKKYTTYEIEKLFQSFQNEMGENLLFLSSVKKIQISTIDKRGKLERRHLVSVERKTKENQCEVKQLKSELKQNLNINKELHYELVLNLDDNFWEEWLVVQRFGFEESVPRDIQNLYSSGDLGLLPVAGLAILKSSQSRKTVFYKAFCTLPLPIETGIPIHINGQFALDNETRTDIWWPEVDSYRDTRSLWNEHLVKSVVVKAYAELIKISKKEICRYKNKKSDWLCQYNNLFPCIPKIKGIWRYLAVSLYEYIVTKEMQIFPVLQNGKQHVLCRWVAISSNDVFFEDLETYFKNLYPPKDETDECFNNKSMQFACLLRGVGMKLLNSPLWMYESLKHASLSVKKINPRSVLNFLKSFEELDEKCQLTINKYVGKTLMKSTENVIMTLEFCLLDNSIKCDELEGAPLLLTSDGFLRKFTRGKNIYYTNLGDYVKIFPKSQYRLLHHNLAFLCGRNKLFNPYISKLELDNLCEVLNENLIGGIKHEVSVPFHDIDFPCRDWLKTFWNFIGRQYDNFLFHGRGDLKCFLENMIFHLGKWALLPVRRNSRFHHQYENKLLYPLKIGKSIFDMLDCEVTKTMQAMGLPYLDRTEIIHEDLKKSSLIVASSFVANSANVLEILECILSNTKNIDMKANCEILMEYFESKASNLKQDTESKEKLKRLPFYENLLDEYQTLEGCKTFVMLPKEAPTGGLHQLCLKTTVQFLKHKQWMCVYERAGCHICDVVEVYQKYILPHFSDLPDRDIVKHMETLKDIVISRLISKSKSEQNSIMELLQQVAFLVQNGNRYTANKFYNPQKKIYHFLCQKHELPPAPFDHKDWIPFLIKCGLKDKVTEEIFIFFALRVEKIGKEQRLTDEVKKYSSILIETLQKENMFRGNEKFLEEVKKIHFILPHTLEHGLMNIHSQHAAAQLLNFADSELVRNKELVWTSIGLLNEKACTLVDDKHIWQILGHDEKPPEEQVFKHIKLICQQFGEGFLTKLEEDNDLDAILSSVFLKIYSYLEDISCSERISSLKETPFIYVKERKSFASPDIVVLNMDDEHEIFPYLYKAPTYFGQYHAVFLKFGASEKLSSNHYANVLKELYKRSDGGIIDPNEKAMTVKAVQLLFEKLRKEISDVQLKSELYLPSKGHVLLSSKSLVFVDNKVLEERIPKGYHNLKYALGFKELNMKDVHDPVKEISLIPIEMRPKFLSKIVVEEVSPECKTYSCRSKRATFLEKFLCCEDFIKSVIRLVRHERYQRNKECGEIEETQIRDIFKMLKVFEVVNLTTVLRLNSEVVKNTERQTQISYSIDAENSNLVCIYLNYLRRPENTKWIESIANDLTRIINCLLKNELSESCLHLAHVLGFIENPECIKEFLDSKQIISLEDSASDEPFIPELGSEIPVKLHHLLKNSFKSLAINEYVGYEQFDSLIDDDSVQNGSLPVFLFAQVKGDETKDIKNVWEKRYRIDIGLKDEIVVNASCLYKFDRKPQRDLRMKFFTQHKGNGKKHTSVKIERNLNLKEEKKNIKNIMKDTLKKPLNERKRIWKRLLLQYHPDKHMENKDYYTKLTQYINSLIQRIENGQTLDYDSEDEVDSGTGFRRRNYNRPSGSTFGQGFNFSSFYEQCFNRGRSYANYERTYRPPEEERSYFQEFRRRGSQPGQADRWYRQAKYDLDAARGSEGRENAHNWVCFKCHQAVEKALKALLYQKDADLFMRTHDLSMLASRCGYGKLESLVLTFEEVTKSYDAMRYPDGVASGSTPSEFYTKEQASNAIKQASEILNVIKTELDNLKSS